MKTKWIAELMSIGKNISNRMKELDITPAELSRLSKIPTTTLNGIIHDRNLPRADNIKKIAIALHTTSDRILFDDDEWKEEDELKRLFLETSRMKKENLQLAKQMLKALIIQNKSDELAHN